MYVCMYVCMHLYDTVYTIYNIIYIHNTYTFIYIYRLPPATGCPNTRQRRTQGIRTSKADPRPLWSVVVKTPKWKLVDSVKHEI